MKNNLSPFLSLLILLVGPLVVNCSKPDVSFKRTGLTTAEDFLANPSVANALSFASPKISIYAGPNPPNIEGDFSTTQCHYSSVSPNLNIEKKIGQNLNSTLRFSSQTLATILVGDDDSKLSFSSNGTRSLIFGGGNYVTVYTENLNSDGSTNVSILSGQVIAPDTIQMLNVCIVTANPPPGINVGDWFSTEGVLIRK